MRVAVVHSFYSSRQPSGENVVVREQIEQLERTGHEVLLVAQRTDDRERRPGYPLRAAGTTVTGFGASPDRALREFAPDVVHLHNTFPNWGTGWLRTWGSRTVVTLHNYRTVCANGLLFRDGAPCTDCLRTPVLPAVRHACYRDSRAASVPVAVGSAPGGGLRRLLGQVARVITLNSRARTVFSDVVGRQVDLVPNFARALDRREEPTRRWVYVGRLGSEKGIGELLRDWPEGEALDVIGSGPLDEEVRRDARGRADVRFLGLLPREDVLDRLPSYTGLVLPSMCAESLPTVILEGLAAGVPAVMSRHIETAEEIQAAGAGLVFDVGNASLRPALAEVDRRGGEMRAASSGLHQQRFSPEAWQRAVDAIYDDVVASHVGSAGGR